MKKDSDADGPQLHKTRKVCLTGSKHMHKGGCQVAGEALSQYWDMTPEERREFLHQYREQTTARKRGQARLQFVVIWETRAREITYGYAFAAERLPHHKVDLNKYPCKPNPLEFFAEHNT